MSAADQTEHQVVVVLDVTAPDRVSAARAAVGLMNGTRGRFALQDGTLARTVVESWWFPEADLKQIDGNDNAAMHLEHDEPPKPSMGQQLDAISQRLDATGAAWSAAGWPSTGPERDAREAAFADLHEWNQRMGVTR